MSPATRIRRPILADDLTPVAAYAALRARSMGAPSFLLESAPLGGERWGRYSVIGWRPRRTVTLDLLEGGAFVRLRVSDVTTGTDIAEVEGPRSEAIALLRAHAFHGPTPAVDANARRVIDANTRRVIDANTRRVIDANAPRVVDATVGYVAYDLVHALEPIAPWSGERRLARLLEGATFVVFDALLQTWTIYGDDVDAVDATIDALHGAPSRLRPLAFPDRHTMPVRVDASIDDAAFSALVRRAQEYIRAGDIFQVVLARVFSTPRQGADPFDAYRALRVLNPSPYLYYLDLGRAEGEDAPDAIVGASPETLVRLEDGLVTVRPVAGTRPRGVDEASDDALAVELLADPKELAEHVMLVDLGRNDVGRVADIGTVKVPMQMSVERYSHVMHLVSEVQGRLAAGRDAWDLLAATFPAGTLSGAPKVRAMQIIRELEPSPRGVYGGAIGYVSRHGTMDFAIAIRTLVAWPDRFDVGAGAGIVEASVPALEAQESRHKASASLAAIAAAVGGSEKPRSPS